jgi:hypothetical protein
MLTRIGFGLLGVGIGVALLIPVVAVTFVVGRHLSGLSMIGLFGLLVLVAALLIAGIVRSVHASGST